MSKSVIALPLSIVLIAGLLLAPAAAANARKEAAKLQALFESQGMVEHTVIK